MKLRTSLPALVAVAVLAAGCTSEAVEPPGLTATPTAGASSTPSATADADPALEPSDPELGIVFEDVPELSGAEVEVYNVAAGFSKEYWRMMTTNTVSPGLDVLASPEVRAQLQGIVDQNVGQQVVLDGVFRSRVFDVAIDGSTATAMLCDDYREVTGTDPNGTYSALEMGLENLASALTLGPSVAGSWTVMTVSPAGAC